MDKEGIFFFELLMYAGFIGLSIVLIVNQVRAGMYAKKVFMLLEQEMGPLRGEFEDETPEQRAKAAQYQSWYKTEYEEKKK